LYNNIGIAPRGDLIVSTEKSFFIFSSAELIKLLHHMGEQSKKELAHLFQRLGVKPQSNNKRCIIIAICKDDSFCATDFVIDTFAAYEKVAKRRIDQTKITVSSFASIDEASKHPHTENASFVFFCWR
jgi:hypothetical protein